MTRSYALVNMTVVLTLAVLLTPVSAGFAAPVAAGSVAGLVFADLNADGHRQSGEAAWEGHRLYVYDAGGAYVGTTVSDATGAYRFEGLAPGTYDVRYAANSWWEVREQWVPTTTGTLRPEQTVEVAATQAAAVADFGWREIRVSTDLAAPISEYVGPDGLRVQSYNDVVPASEVHAAVTAALVGAEAPHVTVRFGYGNSSTTTASVATADGRYSSYRAVSSVSYVSWIDTGHRTLTHEYGHAWSLYHAYLIQQDPDLRTYLQARGLAGDERLNTSYAWSARELIADDYRQLFGPPGVRDGRLNVDLPAAEDVSGLREFLSGPFMTGDGQTAPEPDPTPTAEPTAEPTPEPSEVLTLGGLAMSPASVQHGGTVSFTVSGAATIDVHILDAAGTPVATLWDDRGHVGGAAEVRWDRRDDGGKRVRRGRYQVRVDARDRTHRAVDTVTFEVT